MKTILKKILHSTLRLNKVVHFKTASLMMMSVTILSGCLISGPYWGQEFDSRTDDIPLQAWTAFATEPVRVECSQAYHAGLYPWYNANGNWMPVTTLYPQNPGVLDPKGTRIYSVGESLVLPEHCWRNDRAYSNPKYFTAIRMVQTVQTSSGMQDIVFSTLDREGLECVGTENGRAASWTGYYGKDCVTAYSSGKKIPFVIINAKS